MKWFKREWDESRGDDYDHWGQSIYYFEVASDGSPNRQIEVYENGSVLLYDQDHLHDQYGMLGDQPLDLDEFTPFEISQSEFDELAKTVKPINR